MVQLMHVTIVKVNWFFGLLVLTSTDTSATDHPLSPANSKGMYNAFNAADCKDDGHDTTLPLPMSRRHSDSDDMLDQMSLGKKHQSDNGTIVDDDVVIDDFFENWECCDGIRTFYMRHCERTGELESARLLGIMLVLLVCTMMKAIIKRLGIQWLPDACLFIIVGAIVGGLLRAVNRHVVQDKLLSFDTDLFLQILLPPIIFQAALSIDKRAFRRDLFPILAFASLGTAFSAIAIGLITHYLSTWMRATTLPLLDSLVFGSLISSIDPVATLGILSSVGVSQTDTLYTLIFGESLLNDGVAIVLFDTLKVHLGEDAKLDQTMYDDMIKHFVLMLLGSIGIGVVCGMACTIYFWALRGRQSANTEVMIFFCWSLIPYYIAEGVHCSGIISIMVMGFMLDYYVIGGFQSDEVAWMDYVQMRNNQINGSGNNIASSGRATTAAPANHHQYPHLQQQHPGGFGNTPFPTAPTIEDRWSQFRTSWCMAFSGRGHILSRSRHHVGFVAQVIASLMDTAIFAYLGLFLFNDSGWNFRLNFIAILGCVSSRAVMVVVLSLLINLGVYCDFENTLYRLCKSCRRTLLGIAVQQQQQHQQYSLIRHESSGSAHGIGQDDDEDEDSLASTTRTYLDRKTQVILLLSGIRGAVSFALVENIPVWDAVAKTGSQYKPELKAMTSTSIFFTLFVFGALTYFMVQGGGADSGRGARVAGSLTHRLLSEPLDSGDEGDGEASEVNSSSALEFEPRPHRSHPQPQQHHPGAYRHPDPLPFHNTNAASPSQQYLPVPTGA